MLPVLLFAISVALRPELASSLNKQGLAAASEGRFAQAEQFYSQAIAAWRELGPAYKVHLAINLTNLGQARQNTGDWTGAIECYREAVRLDASAPAISRLGGALAAVGQTIEAEPMLRKALSIQEASHPEDPETGFTMNNLALLYGQAGRWSEAEPLVQKAVEIFNRATGTDSVETAMLLANLASVHMQQGRPERAEPLFRRARITYEKTLGGEHPQLAMVLSQEGLLLLEQNKQTLATAELKRAVDILRVSTGPESLDTSIAESNLALAYRKANKVNDAATLLTHALSVQDRLYTKPSRQLAITLTTLAACRSSQRRYDEAVALYDRAVHMFESASGPSHPDTMHTQSAYAEALRHARRQKATLSFH